VTPDPVQIATEGALWGSIHAHAFLRDTVTVSDDAGQSAMLSSAWPKRVPSWASRSGIISAVAAELPANQPCRIWRTSSAAEDGQRKPGARVSAHLTLY
jgi:hypothetical protein